MASIPTLHRRAHVRGELGPVLARRPRPVRRRVDGRPPGLVRRADDPAVRRARGGRRLADQQRDADLRPRSTSRPPYRAGVGLGAAHGAGGARRRGQATGLDRRRRLGRRGDRRGQRLLRTRHSAALIDFVGPHVYRMEGDARPPAPTTRPSSASSPAVAAGRSCWRSSAAPPTSPSAASRALLPAVAAQLPARRCHRLDRLEQHRLRPPGRPGPRTATIRSRCTSASPRTTAPRSRRC